MINELVNDDCDCVIASRWRDGFWRVNEPVYRKIQSRMFNALVRLLFDLPFTDTQAGLKFFRRRVLKSIDIKFLCKDFSFDVEFLFKLKQQGFKVKEMKVISRRVEGSTFSVKHVPNTFLSLIRLRFLIFKNNIE